MPSKPCALAVDESLQALAPIEKSSITGPVDPSQRKINFNPTYDQLWAPIAGPAYPYSKDGIAQGMRNHKLGFVEDALLTSSTTASIGLGMLLTLLQTWLHHRQWSACQG
ncbi:hypothetical protein L7F22_038066 [Adiantum nelumboides]|nr:hypothetical protein [Adiantum nelumboides]